MFSPFRVTAGERWSQVPTQGGSLVMKEALLLLSPWVWPPTFIPVKVLGVWAADGTRHLCLSLTSWEK